LRGLNRETDHIAFAAIRSNPQGEQRIYPFVANPSNHERDSKQVLAASPAHCKKEPTKITTKTTSRDPKNSYQSQATR
jgi:hypothetical protein